MKTFIVKTGSLWLGEEWTEALKKSIESSECGIEEVYKWANLNNVFDDKKILIGYQMFGYGNRRKYITKIPKRYNDFVKKLLEL
jgi:hypothetical protein